MSDTSITVILDMLFLTLSNADMLFTDQELIWSLYISVKVLLITKGLQIIVCEKFEIVALNLSKETFVIYIVSFNLSLKVLVYPA